MREKKQQLDMVKNYANAMKLLYKMADPNVA
jgi:hypothetical protein